VTDDGAYVISKSRRQHREVWCRLTKEGRRSPEQLSPKERAEYDALALMPGEIASFASPEPLPYR
jgi:hypothetical protein